jgi:hypothetical protein
MSMIYFLDDWLNGSSIFRLNTQGETPFEEPHLYLDVQKIVKNTRSYLTTDKLPSTPEVTASPIGCPTDSTPASPNSAAAVPPQSAQNGN